MGRETLNFKSFEDLEFIKFFDKLKHQWKIGKSIMLCFGTKIYVVLSSYIVNNLWKVGITEYRIRKGYEYQDAYKHVEGAQISIIPEHKASDFSESIQHILDNNPIINPENWT